MIHAAGPVDEPGRGTANIPRLCGAQDEPVSEEVYEAVLCLLDDVWESKYRAIRTSFKKVLDKHSKGAYAVTCTCCQCSDLLAQVQRRRMRAPTRVDPPPVRLLVRSTDRLEAGGR